MRTQRLIGAAAGLLGWFSLGLGIAEAGVISKVGGGGTVTLSIYESTATGFVDITDDYLPTWTPPGTTLQTVYIVVNGPTDTLSLVAPATASFPLTVGMANPFVTGRTTSAYPGNCTNFGTDTGADFTFSTADADKVTFTVGGVTKTGYPLTSNDCGGMAVIQVGSDKFVIPKDSDASGNPNGLADKLEVFGVSLALDGDNDSDGIKNIDELRGSIVSGIHERTNPTVKDAFVFLVKPKCGSPSLLGGGSVTYPIPGAGALTANLVTLIPPPSAPPTGISTAQVHFLGASTGSSSTVTTTEWVDHFFDFLISGGKETWKYCNAASTATNTPACSTADITVPTGTAPPDDRVSNKNRVYEGKAKGLRITECLDTSKSSPLGSGRWGSATSGKDEGIIYTQRIVNYINGIGRAGQTIYYSTFLSGAWTALATQYEDLSATGGDKDGICETGENCKTVDREFCISKETEYILAMEIGHTVKLIADETAVTFPHLAAGQGDNMDEAARFITSGSPAGVKCYIPTLFGSGSQGTFVLSP